MEQNELRARDFITVPEAARRTGLGLRQFRRAVRDGELATYSVGDWPRLRWSQVEAWLESRRTCRCQNRVDDDSLIHPRDRLHFLSALLTGTEAEVELGSGFQGPTSDEGELSEEIDLLGAWGSCL